MSKPGWHSTSLDDELWVSLEDIGRDLTGPTGEVPKIPKVIRFLRDEYIKQTTTTTSGHAASVDKSVNAAPGT